MDKETFVICVSERLVVYCPTCAQLGKTRYVSERVIKRRRCISFCFSSTFGKPLRC